MASPECLYTRSIRAYVEHVNGSNGPLRTRSKTMRDAAQHVAAQELAVDVDELRVRADRASAATEPTPKAPDLPRSS